MSTVSFQNPSGGDPSGDQPVNGEVRAQGTPLTAKDLPRGSELDLNLSLELAAGGSRWFRHCASQTHPSLGSIIAS